MFHIQLPDPQLGKAWVTLTRKLINILIYFEIQHLEDKTHRFRTNDVFITQRSIVSWYQTTTSGLAVRNINN